MHRKRAALEDADLLTVPHLSCRCVLLCQRDTCLQKATDYHSNLVMHCFPSPILDSRNLAFVLLLLHSRVVSTAAHFNVQFPLPGEHVPKSLHIRLCFQFIFQLQCHFLQEDTPCHPIKLSLPPRCPALPHCSYLYRIHHYQELTFLSVHSLLFFFPVSLLNVSFKSACSIPGQCSYQCLEHRRHSVKCYEQ